MEFSSPSEATLRSTRSPVALGQSHRLSCTGWDPDRCPLRYWRPSRHLRGFSAPRRPVLARRLALPPVR